MSQVEKDIVFLHYGPYEANFIIRHKLQRLHGLIGALKKLQIPHRAIPSPKINHFEVIIRERIITSCDIRNLKFNMRAEDDKICQHIVASIREHCKLFNAERYSKFQDSSNQESSTLDTPGYYEETDKDIVNSSLPSKSVRREHSSQSTASEAYEKYLMQLQKLQTKQTRPEFTQRTSSDVIDLNMDPINQYKVCRKSICSKCDSEKQLTAKKSIDLKAQITYSSLFDQDTIDLTPISDVTTAKPVTISPTASAIISKKSTIPTIPSKTQTRDEHVNNSLQSLQKLKTDLLSDSNGSDKVKQDINNSNSNEGSILLKIYDYENFLCPELPTQRKTSAIPKHFMRNKSSFDQTTKFRPPMIEKSGIAVHGYQIRPSLPDINTDSMDYADYKASFGFAVDSSKRYKQGIRSFPGFSLKSVTIPFNK